MRSATTIILCLVVGLAAGCGSDEEGEPIPAQTASALENQLDGIEDRLAVKGACNDITKGDDPNTRVVDQLIADLPESVDSDVEQALRDGFDRLFRLVDERCAKLDEERDQSETETEEPLIPAEPETTPEPTVPEETTTEETPPPTEPENPGDEGGTPPGQDGTPPGQDGEQPDQGNGGGTFVPEDGG